MFQCKYNRFGAQITVFSALHLGIGTQVGEAMIVGLFVLTPDVNPPGVVSTNWFIASTPGTEVWGQAQ